MNSRVLPRMCCKNSGHVVDTVEDISSHNDVNATMTLTPTKTSIIMAVKIDSEYEYSGSP
ncbi:hypothetical protein FRX31_007918 [Thalictrum thalictroides]|uniref:Uncharacterized protein n=1 Tax=Thalictrum thalictroides TaxID=46969 RepID=A0A7J6WZK4_THATH|nr:hypothetical protein FRX31_007918 [Thalictrum thalictroides]